MAALTDRLEEAAADTAVRALVIAGAGNAFSASGDLPFLHELPAMPPTRIREVVYGTFQRVPRAAFELARRLARGPAQALVAAKAALNRGLDATLEPQTACVATRDFAEGVESLAATRPPRAAGV